MDVTDEVTCTLRAEAHHPPCVLESASFCTEHSAKARGIGYEEETSPTLRAGTVPAAICYENHSQDTRYTGPLETAPTVSATYGMGGNNQPFVVEPETPKTLKIRSGCEGGGKGPIIQDDKSATLSCNNDQTVFVPFCKGTRPHSAEEAPAWKDGKVANTLNAFDVGESRCNELVVQAYGVCSKDSNAMKSDNPHSGFYEAETSRTLDGNGGNPSCNQGGIAVVEPEGMSAFHINQRDEVIDLQGKSGALMATRNMQMQTFVLQGSMIGRDDKNGPQGSGVGEDVSFTLDATDRHAVVQPTYCTSKNSHFTRAEKELANTLVATDYKDPPVINDVQTASGKEVFGTLSASMGSKQWLGNQEAFSGDYHIVEPEYIVRRLTPTECARLQGFPDWWCGRLGTEEPTEEDLAFWREVFETHRKIAGTSTKPKIDLIITKSVSRFARNTVDSLSTIRKLKDNGTECYFEKENIWTFDSKGELLITIMSSLAQEESRSISENCTWGMRKRFADGKVTVPFGRFLGYDRGEDGNLVVNEEQAKIVRKIYGLFLQGRSPYQIAKILTEKGIPTPGGKKIWGKAVVESILTNEKYKGDALLQKVYTVDFLSKKKKVNEGEVPQYYVEGNHEAIIPPAVFDNVQVLMQSRGKGNGRNSCVSIFSSKIRCGDCGGWYGSKVWHSNDKYRKVIWQCNHKFDRGEKCTTPHLDEETIRQLFIKALNTINREKIRILAGFEEIRDTAFETGELDAEARQLNGEMNVAAELIQKCIGENARVAQNQGEYAKRYDALVERFETAKARLEEVQAAITEKQAQQKMLENFMEELRGLPQQVDYFYEGAWYAMVDFVTVYGREDVRFTFKNGMEIPVKTK